MVGKRELGRAVWRAVIGAVYATCAGWRLPLAWLSPVYVGAPLMPGKTTSTGRGLGAARLDGLAGERGSRFAQLSRLADTDSADHMHTTVGPLRSHGAYSLHDSIFDWRSRRQERARGMQLLPVPGIEVHAVRVKSVRSGARKALSAGRVRVT